MKRILLTAGLILLVPVMVLWTAKIALGRNTRNFRAEYMERIDRAQERFQKADWGPLAPEVERELVEAHRPQLVVSRGSQGPIDIDTDYLALHHPVDCDTTESLAPDARRELLASLPRTDNVCLNEGPARQVFPPPGPICGGAEGSCAKVFTAVEYENVQLDDSDSAPPLPWIFLRYQFVFARSGLPAGLIDVQKLADRLGSSDNWHPLDLHLFAWVVLDETLKPVATILTQHQGHRSYVYGTDIPWPQEGRPAIVSALRSNELYPDLPIDVRRRIRATPFPGRRVFLVTGEGRNYLDGDDIVCGRSCGGIRWDYRTEPMHPDNPLWKFRGYLGPRRLDFGLELGRSGPAGGRYHTFPELARRSDLLFFSYFQDGDVSDAAAARTATGWWWRNPPDMDFQALIRHGRQRFRMSLESARKNPQQLAPLPDDFTGEPDTANIPSPTIKPIIEPDFREPKIIGTFQSKRRASGASITAPTDAEGISLEPGPVEPSPPANPVH